MHQLRRESTRTDDEHGCVIRQCAVAEPLDLRQQLRLQLLRSQVPKLDERIDQALFAEFLALLRLCFGNPVREQHKDVPGCEMYPGAFELPIGKYSQQRAVVFQSCDASVATDHHWFQMARIGELQESVLRIQDPVKKRYELVCRGIGAQNRVQPAAHFRRTCGFCRKGPYCSL